MNYIKTWKEVMLRPSDFFRMMNTAEGYTDPLIFALISIILNVLFFTLFRDGMLRFGVHPSILTSGIMQDSGFNFTIFSNIIEPFAICIQCAFIMAQAFNLVSKARRNRKLRWHCEFHALYKCSSGTCLDSYSQLSCWNLLYISQH